jgi:hypothetical protein
MEFNRPTKVHLNSKTEFLLSVFIHFDLFLIMKKVYSFFRTLAILYDAFFFNNTKKNIFAYSAQVKKDYKY